MITAADIKEGVKVRLIKDKYSLGENDTLVLKHIEGSGLGVAHLAIPTAFQKLRQRVGRFIRELRGFIEISIKVAALGALIRFILHGIL